jgi:tRNA1(Val) A37 N6-methylase TrmN6
MSIYTIDDFTDFKQEIKVTKEDKLEYGEIYTPFSFIHQILNLFAPEVFTDPTKTWLDVGAGQGYFSMILFARLNKGLIHVLPNENERKTHIIQNMLFMSELKESNVMALKQMFGEKANIITGDFCAYDFSCDDVCIYDYIIGNPPYNSHGMKKVPTNKERSKTHDGTTLWTKFITKSLTLLKPTTGQMCMIIPSIWLKPDKSQIHQRLTSYKIEKIHCFSNTETNAIFKGEAQTPSCFFLLTNTITDNIIQLYDTQRKAYVNFSHTTGKPIPLFGSYLIKKLQPWLIKAGALKIQKTNMPSKNSQFTTQPYTTEYPYMNVTTCVLYGLHPELLLNYSNIPQAFHGMKKLILAHKMYGFPYWDKQGTYGISNRDNYVILQKTDQEFEQLAAFLSTKFALYIFEAARYRMKYLEKYAFEFIPDITRLANFPSAKEITDESVALFFGLDEEDKKHIQNLHKKNYERFV